ncbi:MAG: hypothetical protein ACREMW_07605 [Gemmatimonadales bacterium]
MIVRTTHQSRACGATATRVMALTLVVAGVLGGVLAAQEPATPPVRAAKLVISHNGVPITDWLVIPGVPDSLTLTIVPQDSLGNVVPITGFEIQVWDPMVLGVLGTEVQASQVVVRLQPRRRGQTTIQIRMSGTRQWVLVGLRETVLAISPGQVEQPGVEYAPGWRVWTAGARLNLMTYSFDFQGDTTFAGNLGFLAEAYGGLEWSSGFALVGGIGLGGMKADSVGTSVAVSLVELSIRAQYAFMPLNKVRPVVEFGGGMYRARSGTVNQGIWNASFFFLGGAGVDVTFAPKVVGEFRVGNRQQFEWTSSHANGHVASLFYFGAGVRARF